MPLRQLARRAARRERQAPGAALRAVGRGHDRRDVPRPAAGRDEIVHPAGSSVGYPASGSAFVARTQGAPIVATIGATEDAATGGETPPGSCRTSGRVY